MTAPAEGVQDELGVFTLSGTDDSESPYWQSDVAKALQPATRKLLETYCGIAPDQVEQRIKEIQKRAWNVAPFPSVGSLTWLNPYITLLPQYAQILAKVKAGSSILDCGCMVAPDLRQMVFDGAPSANMYGFDLEDKFFDIGFDLYNDRESWAGQFIQADATKPFDESKLGNLAGKIDVIWCAKFIHLFDRQGQIDMMSRLVSLLKPQAGSIFAGSQNGYPGGKTVKLDGKRFASLADEFFLGDAPDNEAMWQEVSQRTGTEWALEARLIDMRTMGLHQEDGTSFRKLTGYCLQWVATRK